MSRSRILAAMLSTGIENDEARPTDAPAVDENGNPIATEPAPEAEPAVEIAEDTEAAAVAEVAEGADEVAEVVDVVEELNEASEGLEGLYIDIAAARKDGGLSAQAFRGYNAAVESYSHRVGMIIATPAVESFGGATSRIHATASLESGVMDKIKEIVKKIIEAIKAAFRKVGDWFRKVKLGAERLTKRAEALKEKSSSMKNAAELEINGKWVTNNKKQVSATEAADELGFSVKTLSEITVVLADAAKGISDKAASIAGQSAGAVKEDADKTASAVLKGATSSLSKSGVKPVNDGSGDEVVLGGADLVGGKRLEIRYNKAADAAAMGSFQCGLASAPNFKPAEKVKVSVSAADVASIADRVAQGAKDAGEFDAEFRKREESLKEISSKLDTAANATLKDQNTWSAEDKAAVSALIRNAARPLQCLPGLATGIIAHAMAGFSGLLDIAAKAVSEGSKEKKAA